MGSEDSIYEPSVSYMSEGNAGGRATRNPQPTLRIFKSSHKNPWLMYGAVVGGDQDDQKGCAWFEIFYHGILKHEGRETFGYWRMRVEGKDLDTLCGQVAAHTLPTLSTGPSGNSLSPYQVESIKFEPMEGLE